MSRRRSSGSAAKLSWISGWTRGSVLASSRRPRACGRSSATGSPIASGCAHRRDRLLAADASHVDVAEHDLLHVVELPGAGCGVADHHLRERGLRVAAAGLGDQQQPGDRVIGESRANAGKVRDGLDAQASQRGYGADSRAKQDRRRADGAAASVIRRPRSRTLWP